MIDIEDETSEADDISEAEVQNTSKDVAEDEGSSSQVSEASAEAEDHTETSDKEDADSSKEADGKSSDGESEVGSKASDADASQVKDDADEDMKDKRSFFERKKEKDTEKLKEEINELREKTVRQLAEFENFRKRTDKEKSRMFDMGAKDVIEKMLPVMDSFERGLEAKPDDEASKAFVEGMELIYRQMKKAFDDMGVKPIEAVGKPFDPNLHSAVMTVDDDTKESGTVAEELQKGYMYKDSVVRHSMVKVVN